MANEPKKPQKLEQSAPAPAPASTPAPEVAEPAVADAPVVAAADPPAPAEKPKKPGKSAHAGSPDLPPEVAAMNAAALKRWDDLA